jgi:hypothetical protein
MPQCTPTQHNKKESIKKNKSKEEKGKKQENVILLCIAMLC